MFRVIRDYYKKYIKDITLDFLCVLAQMGIQLIFITGESKKILDNGVYKMDMDYIISGGTRMLIFTVIMALLIILQTYSSGKVTAGVVQDIRNDCFKKITALSSQDFAYFGGSTLNMRTIVDPENIQIMTINLLRTSMMVPVLIICISVMMLSLNTVMGIVFLFFFALAILTFAFFSKRARTSFSVLQEKIDRTTLLVSEKVSGVRPIRAFNNQEYEEDRLEEANKEAYDTAIAANNKIHFLAPLSMIIMNWAVIIIYFLGSAQLKSGMIQISDLLLYFTYIGYFVSALAVVPVWVNLYPKLTVSCRRIFELLDYKTSEEAKEREGEKIEAGDIEFRNVSFGYNSSVPVIDHVSFCVKGGSSTAIIGTTGSGKTTLLNLLSGTYRMQDGEIWIGKNEIRDISRNSLVKTISYATQVVQMYNDTVFNNISMYDSECTAERVKKACDMAQFTEVLETKNEGFEFVVEQSGTNLSGGQKQRLSLARAFAKDTPIYLLDDSLSALDAKTEKLVLNAINEELKTRTVIMVAQKIASIMDMDSIIVLKEGSITGQGTHEELLSSCDEYKAIYKTQFYQEGRQ